MHDQAVRPLGAGRAAPARRTTRSRRRRRRPREPASGVDVVVVRRAAVRRSGQPELHLPRRRVGRGQLDLDVRRRAEGVGAAVTGASTAGSWTVMSPACSSFSSTSTTTAAKVSPTRSCSTPASTRSRTAFSYWWARRPDSRIVSGSSPQLREHPAGTSVAGAQRDADLAGVAVAEPAQRRGDVGVLRGQRGVLAAARAPRRRSRRSPLPRSSRVQADDHRGVVGLAPGRASG